MTVIGEEQLFPYVPLSGADRITSASVAHALGLLKAMTNAWDNDDASAVGPLLRSVIDTFVVGAYASLGQDEAVAVLVRNDYAWIAAHRRKNKLEEMPWPGPDWGQFEDEPPPTPADKKTGWNVFGLLLGTIESSSMSQESTNSLLNFMSHIRDEVFGVESHFTTHTSVSTLSLYWKPMPGATEPIVGTRFQDPMPMAARVLLATIATQILATAGLGSSERGPAFVQRAGAWPPLWEAYLLGLKKARADRSQRNSIFAEHRGLSPAEASQRWDILHADEVERAGRVVEVDITPSDDGSPSPILEFMESLSNDSVRDLWIEALSLPPG